VAGHPVLEEQAKDLERLAEHEEFQRLTVGRELKMIELKKEIEYLRKFGPQRASQVTSIEIPPILSTT
jgi:hypothetical protein